MDFFQFLWRVLVHWGALVTGGIFIAGLTIYQGVGHPVPHWAYWTIAGVALFWASFLAWRDEYRKSKEFEANLRALQMAHAAPPIQQNIYLPPRPPLKPEQPKHNVQCLGVKVEDQSVTIGFQNVPIPGRPIADFPNARLRAEYRLETTGEEWLTIFPARWISDNQNKVPIGMTPQWAFLATYYETDSKWKALISLENASNDFSWNDRIQGIALPTASLLVTATLIGEGNLSLEPIRGILALGEGGKASWILTDQ